jgi:hypothetical protein
MRAVVLIKSEPVLNSGKYPAILPVLTILWLLLCIGAGAQDSGNGTSSETPSVTRTDISSAMADLTKDKTFHYTEGSLDEPIWLMWLRSKIAQWWQRWKMSAPGPMSENVGRTVAYSVTVLAILLAVGWLVVRLVAGPKGLFKRKTSNGAVGDQEGGWFDTGIAEATKLASSGNFKEALSALFRALLKGLDKTGWISYQKGRASRAYLRHLRRSDLLYPLFRDFLWRFELAFYREVTPREDDWEYLYDVYGRLAKTVNELPIPILTGKR